jgi:hypothetical protein
MKNGERSPCVIDWVTPLPLEIHNVFLGLDRKMKLERRLDRVKLSAAEKKALLFVAEFYKSNPIENEINNGD